MAKSPDNIKSLLKSAYRQKNTPTPLEPPIAENSKNYDAEHASGLVDNQIEDSDVNPGEEFSGIEQPEILDETGNESVYTKPDIQPDLIDELLAKASTANVFSTENDSHLDEYEKSDDSVPPETIPIDLITDDIKSEEEKNVENLTLLEQVEEDKKNKKKYRESLKTLRAIEAEQGELEEIMRQKLIRQQEEEKKALDEGLERIKTRNSNFLKLLEQIHSLENDEIQSNFLEGIAETFKTDNLINLHQYLVINRYLYRFNIPYDRDEIKVFLSEDLLSIDTPPLDFNYYYFFESELNNLITPYMWDKHKLMVFERANFKCELCGGVGDNNPVDLYPQWKMFDSNRTQILQGFLALCPKCIDAKNHQHLKDRSLKLRYETAREHIKNVNNWDDKQVENTLNAAETQYHDRLDLKAEPDRHRKWKLNISILESIFGIMVGEPKFNQRSHIKNEHYHIFAPHVQYLFSKIESDRMIKTGKTKFLSIKLDVEAF